MDMREYGDNIGGVHEAWVGLAAIVQENPNPSILDGLDRLGLYPLLSRYQQTTADTEQGPIYTKSFNTPLLSDSEAVRAIADKYQGREVALIIQDLDFRYWLFFWNGHPGIFLSDFASGSAPADGKSHTVNITGTNTQPRKLLDF